MSGFGFRVSGFGLQFSLETRTAKPGTRISRPDHARTPSFISSRALAIDASGIRKVFDLAAKMKDPINLSIGQPDFDVPDVAKDAAIEAIQTGRTATPSPRASTPLRTKLAAESLRRDRPRRRRGARHLRRLRRAAAGHLATINPGDEVLFLDPYFVMYKHLLTLAGGKPRRRRQLPRLPLPRRPRRARHHAARRKLLILNSPSNPTGAVMSQHEIRGGGRHRQEARPADHLRRNLRTIPLRRGASRAASTPRRLYDKTLILRGFSKSHAMTGWRSATPPGREAIIQQMTKLQQYTFVCARQPLQHAAVAALDIDMSQPRRRLPHEARHRFETLEEIRSRETRRRVLHLPQGPATASPPPISSPRAIENNVLVIPGNVFSDQDTHFRISYATTRRETGEGV